MLERIKADIELIRFDGVTEISVFTGGLSNLKLANIEWTKEKNELSEIFCFDYIETISLSEIVNQIGKDEIITIIINGPLQGEIWQYGNYGEEWYKLGEVCGYA